MKIKYLTYLTILLTTLSGCIQSKKNKKKDISNDDSVVVSKQLLGEKLFSDTNLSLDRTMSCATCHNPQHAFIDNRENFFEGSVSIGQDGISIGDRNSPTIMYTRFIPSFTQVNGEYIGGLFTDGRAVDLTEQAKGPFLNSIELQMPSEESVINRIKENSEYITAFQNIYGEDILDNADRAFEAVAEVITEFEKTDSISPFNSQFDKGNLTTQELRGRELFKSANCNLCHDDTAPRPVFSNFGYHNLGLPTNEEVRNENGVEIDLGLASNPNVTDNNQRGKFRIASLRNIAVTAPYMHNGVFKELKTVVHFYNTRDVAGAINPETGLSWRTSEVPEGVVTPDPGEIGIGNLGLTDDEEDDLVAFLKTLTDEQFEHLIE